MYKFVHNLNNTPVLVRDVVLPQLLSIFILNSHNFPNSRNVRWSSFSVSLFWEVCS